MKIDGFVKMLLLVIAIFLGIIALRPYAAPPVAEALSGGAYPVYIEPGNVAMSSADGRHNEVGKHVIDLRNGNLGISGAGASAPPYRDVHFHATHITSVFGWQVGVDGYG